MNGTPRPEDLQEIPALARQALERLEVYMNRVTALAALQQHEGQAPARPKPESNGGAEGDTDRSGEETPVSPGDIFGPGPSDPGADSPPPLADKELHAAAADDRLTAVVIGQWWQRCGIEAVCAFARKAGHVLDSPEAAYAGRRFARAKHDRITNQPELAEELRTQIETLAERAQLQVATPQAPAPDPGGAREPKLLPDPPADAQPVKILIKSDANDTPAFVVNGERLTWPVGYQNNQGRRMLRQLCKRAGRVVPDRELDITPPWWEDDPDLRRQVADAPPADKPEVARQVCKKRKIQRRQARNQARTAIKQAFKAAGLGDTFDAIFKRRTGKGYYLAVTCAPALSE